MNSNEFHSFALENSMPETRQKTLMGMGLRYGSTPKSSFVTPPTYFSNH